VTDRDEARFAQSARQMLESGDFVTTRFLDEVRAKKPPGVTWLQAACVAALTGPESRAVWPYRLPSALGVLGASLITWQMGRRWFGRRVGLWAGVLLPTSLLANIQATLATTDAVLLCFLALSMLGLGEVWRNRKARRPAHFFWSALMWLGVALGLLTKGPVALLFAGLPMLILPLLDREATWSAWLGRWVKALHIPMGVAMIALLVGPWVWIVQHDSGGTFLDRAWSEDFWPKITGAQESHGFWPLFYLLTLPVMFWPGSLWTGPALLAAWKNRRHPQILFLLIWLVPAWVVLELAPTKLPHYLLPVYPALALLTAQGAVRWTDDLRGRFVKAGLVFWGLLSVGVAAVVLMGPSAAGLIGWELWVGLGTLAIVVALTVTAVRRTLDARHNAAFICLVSAGVLTLAVAKGVTLPSAHELWPGEEVARRIAPGRSLALVGFQEPSAVFVLGSQSRCVNPPRAAQLLAGGEISAILTDSRSAEAVLSALTQEGITGVETWRWEGWNVSKGEKVSLVCIEPIVR